MRKSTSIYLALALSAVSTVAFSAVAVAADRDMSAESGATAFEDADIDRSGYLDEQEAGGVSALDFDDADADDDGRISREEYEGALKDGEVGAGVVPGAKGEEGIGGAGGAGGAGAGGAGGGAGGAGAGGAGGGAGGGSGQ